MSLQTHLASAGYIWQRVCLSRLGEQHWFRVATGRTDYL